MPGPYHVMPYPYFVRMRKGQPNSDKGPIEPGSSKHAWDDAFGPKDDESDMMVTDRLLELPNLADMAKLVRKSYKDKLSKDQDAQLAHDLVDALANDLLAEHCELSSLASKSPEQELYSSYLRPRDWLGEKE